MNTPLTICLTGSTGAIGNHVLHFLNQQNSVAQIISITRKQNIAPLSKEKNIVIHFDQLSTLKIKADVFICCLGTTIKIAGSQAAFKKVDYDYVVNFAKLAEASSAQKFLVVSSLGAEENSSVFYSRIKGEMESAIKNINIPAIEIFQPSLLLGERAEARAGEGFAKIIAPLLNPLLVGSMKKYRAIEASDVAKALVARALIKDTGLKTYTSDQIVKLF
jgi:uncharacterized protein YbjT (DUF2867 family)